MNKDWKLRLKIGDTLTPKGFGEFDSKLRIPVNGSILLTKEIRELIDTPQFQRLRGVRQLGPTMFVFPGATHTRFEHSLGVYDLTLKYLERLFNIEEFKDLLNKQHHDLDKSIKLIILSSLLHDIGHYPYSHWIEDIGKVPNNIYFDKHEIRLKNVLKESPIKKVLKKWEIEPQLIANIIDDKESKSKNLHDVKTNKSSTSLTSSFINSIIDVDKIDYLIRDSIHCGVDYGRGIDVDRIIDSLNVNVEQKEICMTQKGRSAYMSVLSIRNIMYQEVYWHKTVRSFQAMFKLFFYEYLLSQKGSLSVIKSRLKTIFEYSNDEFVSFLYNWSLDKNSKLNELIRPFAYKGRSSLYKPIYIYFHNNKSQSESAKKFFRKLLELENFTQIVDITKELTLRLKRYGVRYLDIILEVTPKKDKSKYVLDDLKIFNTTKNTFDDCPKIVEPLDEYLSLNRQAFIFCHPDFYNTLKELTVGESNVMDNIFEELS